MSTFSTRNATKILSINRRPRTFKWPIDSKNNPLKISQFYNDLVFDIRTTTRISESVREEILNVSRSTKSLSKKNITIVANAVLDWALKKGATHFCHWFQPLTGITAEKHDAFLQIDLKDRPIEELTTSNLTQGEPDASSFPNGGQRSTFEARGYTTWDLTSPMFLVKGSRSKTLTIPTAFVSYTGAALDIKTPLLRSITQLSEQTTKFLNLIENKQIKSIQVSCGVEQEYFLIDKAFYMSRPDLIMTGRTLFGSITEKNQQLNDHYFGPISERVMAFMEELDYELYRVGIPSKTRHNEVAPAQFEIAAIFKECNITADNNQLLMGMIKKIAERHNFIALLHEKPFGTINGNGKHINWSLRDNNGRNLLSPGKKPQENTIFLAIISIILEAVYRHASALRMGIASAGNDHRLGSNEAPPSIISVFLGDALSKIYDSLILKKNFQPHDDSILNLGTQQLADLFKDNTDRNRTSPFAFTGNKFEFRAVGSGHPVGFPISILNAAVSEVFSESSEIIKTKLAEGLSSSEALLFLTTKWILSSKKIVFNGNGYGDKWILEAKKRNLPNLKTTADCLDILISKSKTHFLISQKIFTKEELEMRYNILIENYITLRNIEFSTLSHLIQKNIFSAVLEYKIQLGQIIKNQEEIKLTSTVEITIYKKINSIMESLHTSLNSMKSSLDQIKDKTVKIQASEMAHNILPVSEEISKLCNQLEELIPNNLWSLPTYHDMLFIQ